VLQDRQEVPVVQVLLDRLATKDKKAIKVLKEYKEQQVPQVVLDHKAHKVILERQEVPATRVIRVK
jgi:glutaredoxin